MASDTRSRPPGPDGLPLLGNTLSLSRDVLGFYERLHRNYGDIVRFEVAGEEAYLLTHPEYVEQVLVAEDATFVKGDVVNRSLGSPLGEGMLLAEGAEWRAQRTLAQPAFYRERVATYGEATVADAAETGENWDGEVIDAHDAMTELTLRILARTLFDVDVRGRGSVVREMAEATRARTDTASLVGFLPDWVPHPTIRAYNRALDDIRAFVEDHIAERKRKPTAERGEDLLSLLVTAAETGEMSKETLRDNMITFLFAGHETTALALTYTWFLLGHHPEVQARLHDELDAVLDGSAPTVADLPDLDYTERVVDEAMRRYPPVYTFFREPIADVEIGGYTVPKEATLSLPQWIVHHDERWYDSPLEFRPERWEGWEGPEYAYYPFGGGPRHCIGMRFARMEAQLIVATLAREFAVESLTDAPLDITASTNAVPADPVAVRFERR